MLLFPAVILCVAVLLGVIRGFTVAESNFWGVKAFSRHFHLSVSRRSQRQQQNQTHHGRFAHPARCAHAASLGLGPNFRHCDDERPGTLNRRVHPYATEQV